MSERARQRDAMEKAWAKWSAEWKYGRIKHQPSFEAGWLAALAHVTAVAEHVCVVYEIDKTELAGPKYKRFQSRCGACVWEGPVRASIEAATADGTDHKGSQFALRADHVREMPESIEGPTDREVAIKLCAALEYLRGCECDGKTGADDQPILDALELARVDIPEVIDHAVSIHGERLTIFESPFEGGAPVGFTDEGSGPYGKIAGCPNCGKHAGEWWDAITLAAHGNAGIDHDGPCSSVCKHQLEHQAEIASQRLTSEQEGSA